MNTPFQHFITLAQRVLDATDLSVMYFKPCTGIRYVSDKAVQFGDFPQSVSVMLIEHNEEHTSATVTFNCYVDTDEAVFDELFIEWTKNVDEFLASDSMLLLDNQIKADLKK